MFHSVARVQTDKASRYIAALCRHFAHKITVDYDAARGRTDFPFGVCRMQAEDGMLVMSCEAPDPEALARVESVVGVHLERFAWREKPVISWVAGDPEAAERHGAGGSS